jgi:uncharacterized repeat protein (TIGR01451 family)
MPRSIGPLLCLAVLAAAGPVWADADYSILKFDAPDPVGPGATLTYTLEVSNEGPDSLVSPLVEDPLPTGTTFQAVSAPAGWTCSTPPVNAGGTVSCSASSMDPGTVVLTLMVRVDPAQPLGSTLSNTATVTSSTVDRSPGDTSATVETTVLSPATLMGQKAVAVSPKGEITYTLTITNAGPAGQIDNPGDEVTDILPSELTLVSAQASAGTAAADTGSNTVTWNGALAAGASVTITIQAVPAAGTLPGQTVTNQGALAFDADGDGSNESTALTDDPSLPGRDDPTSFVVAALPAPEPEAVPTLGETGLVLTALLLAGAGALRLRRRTAR